MSAPGEIPTAEKLQLMKELYDYNPETGELYHTGKYKKPNSRLKGKKINGKRAAMVDNFRVNTRRMVWYFNHGEYPDADHIILLKDPNSGLAKNNMIIKKKKSDSTPKKPLLLDPNSGYVSRTTINKCDYYEVYIPAMLKWKKQKQYFSIKKLGENKALEYAKLYRTKLVNKCNEIIGQ